MKKLRYNPSNVIKPKTTARNCGGIGGVTSGVDCTQLNFIFSDTHSLTHLAIFCKFYFAYSRLRNFNLRFAAIVGVPERVEGAFMQFNIWGLL